MSKPLAVFISDVHYSLPNLALADNAVRQAIAYAHRERVPLIIAGDLHDTKALLRGECVNRMIETFTYAENMGVETIVLIGNHDLINEKAKAHSLEFLSMYTTIVREPVVYKDMYFIPYQSTSTAFEEALAYAPPECKTLVIHQGVREADMGGFVTDYSAIPKSWLANYRTVSGHYHRAQDIKCGEIKDNQVGYFSYLGSPYTMSFAEAKDGKKGYCILYDNGELEMFSTNLRKHIVVETTTDNLAELQLPEYREGDLLWLKVSGPPLDLTHIDKLKLGKDLIGHSSFKLDLIPTNCEPQSTMPITIPSADLLDRLIMSSAESAENKIKLKIQWRKVMS